MAEGPYILKSRKLQDASFNIFFFLPHLFGPLRGFWAEGCTDTCKNRKTQTVVSAPSHSTCDTFCLPPTLSELIAFIYKSHATHLAGCLQGVKINRRAWQHLEQFQRIGDGTAIWGPQGYFPAVWVVSLPLSALQLPLPPYLFTVSEFTLERNTLYRRVGN